MLEIDSRRRAVFRNVLLFFMAIVLPVGGYYFAKFVEEPYPWLMMPGFSGDMRNAEGQFTVNHVNITFFFEDGSRESVPFQDFFYPVASVKARRVYQNMIRPDKRNNKTYAELMGTPDTSRFYYLKRYVVPGLVSRKFNTRPANPHPMTINWFTTVASKHYPQKRLVRFEIERKQSLFDANGKPIASGINQQIELSVSTL